MAKEIGFYCIEEDINAFLYTFLLKLLDNKKKVLIYSNNDEKIEKLDSMLWSLKKVIFLPHLLESDKGAEKTPIVISNKKENKNNANFLLISSFLDDFDFMSSFDKTFYVFSPTNANAVNSAKQDWEKYNKEGFKTTLLKKNQEGKWQELSNIDLL